MHAIQDLAEKMPRAGSACPDFRVECVALESEEFTMSTREECPTPSPSRSPSPSRVRDHLANERTFLAWVRTALGLIGLGFVLARMGLFLRQLAMASGSGPLGHLRAGDEFMVSGVVFLMLGTALCAWTAWLYHRTRWAIEQDRYEPAESTVVVLTAVVVVGGLLIVGLVLWHTLGQD
jgi:putative membrane protein